MEEKDLYLEYKIIPQSWGWVLLILFSASILGYGMMAHMVVPDAPRQWDFGQFPDTPAESVYYTFEPAVSSGGKGVPRVIAVLPGARPLSKEDIEKERRPPDDVEGVRAPLQEHESEHR